jgi:short-subunit dehydrogenase
MKSILISGGSSGIGLATAIKFKQQGFRVGICARRKDLLDELKNKYDFETYELDVANESACREVVYDFYQKGGLDILFANAGKSYAHKNRIPDFKVTREIVAINLYGVINLFEPALEIFLKQKNGHLAATASVAGLNGLPGVSGYSASKSAVIKYCESLSIDLKAENIHVTCVIPGFVDTPLTQVNPHPMPFMIKAEVAAEKIYQGIQSHKNQIYFPWFFSMLVRTLSILPRSLYVFVMGIKIFNYSKEK